MKYILIIAILLLSNLEAMAETITSRDFASGYYLELGRKGALFSFELPEDVYRTVTNDDLSDIRIFNGAGETVPHAIRSVQVDQTSLREKGNIPFFPLHQQNVADDPAGFSLQVSRDRSGAIVTVNSGPPVKGDDLKTNSYLLDLSNLEQAATELEFHWKKELDSSVYTIKIKQSNDLVRWTPIVYSATLADLEFGGQQVIKRTVQLPRQHQKYLQLTWDEAGPPLRLVEVFSFSKVIENLRKHRWVSLYNGTAGDDDGQMTFDFTTSSRFPTSSLQVRFPEPNSIARLLIESRGDSKAAWNRRCEQVFHDLRFEETVLANEPCTIPATADSHWRIVVKDDGAGLLSGNRKPTLQLGWLPSELIFITRGTPPYLLAYGSGKITLKDKGPDGGMLLQAMQKDSTSKVLGQAKLGKKIILGGEQALKSPVRPPPWKQWLLWAVLLLGVGLLAYMARSLAKEMKVSKEKRVSEER